MANALNHGILWVVKSVKMPNICEWNQTPIKYLAIQHPRITWIHPFPSYWNRKVCIHKGHLQGPGHLTLVSLSSPPIDMKVHRTRLYKCLQIVETLAVSLCSHCWSVFLTNPIFYSFVAHKIIVSRGSVVNDIPDQHQQILFS